MSLTFCFDLLSVAHQTVFEVCSSADDSVTADHAAVDVTPANHAHRSHRSHGSQQWFPNVKITSQENTRRNRMKEHISVTCLLCLRGK